MGWWRGKESEWVHELKMASLELILLKRSTEGVIYSCLLQMVGWRKRGKVEGEKRRGREDWTGASDDEGLRRLASAFGLRKE